MIVHPCENCRALYARIERADRVMTALNPIVEAIRTKLPLDDGHYLFAVLGAEATAVVSSFDAYCASELDVRIAEARTDEPAPQTQRSRDVDVDKIVERSR